MSQTYCMNFDAIALSTNTDAKLLARLRCKRWSCEYCSKVNKRVWQAHLLDKLPKISKHWSFITVTARGDDHRSGITLQKIMKNWDKLMKRLKRVWGNFEYMRVYEQHKSGQFHAHMLISYTPDDSLSPSAWKTTVNQKTKRTSKRYRGTAHAEMKKACAEVGLGYIVDFKPLLDMRTMEFSHDVGLTVLYVSKYLGKNLHDMPKNTRRIQTSRAIGSPKKSRDEQYAWQLRSHIESKDVLTHGAITDLTTGHVVTTDDFLVIDHYPLTSRAQAYVNRKLLEAEIITSNITDKAEAYYPMSLF